MKVCLECATPKFMSKAEKGLQRCVPCNKATHTIDAEARRPLCHDCEHFGIKCQDGVWRPALNYGTTYLSQAGCTKDFVDGNIKNAIADVIAPKFAKFDYQCDGFRRHYRAPSSASPNPLSPQERNEWREYLEMPAAFWLEPRRWEGVIDSHKQMFWDKGDHKPSKVKVVALGAALVAGLFLGKKKLVDSPSSGAKPELGNEEIEHADGTQQLRSR